MTTSTVPGNALDSPVFQVIARAGAIEPEELEYQLERAGATVDLEVELDALSESGSIEWADGTWAVTIPERIERRGGDNEGWSPKEILDRVKLWALVCGRPPAHADWNPSKLRRSEERLLFRARRHARLIELYEAGDFPSPWTVREHFGSMNAALVAAGFDPRSAGRQPGPVVPGAPAKRYGPEHLDSALTRVSNARQARMREKSVEAEAELATSLIELATAAFNEAEQLRPWEPDADDNEIRERKRASNPASSVTSSNTKAA